MGAGGDPGVPAARGNRQGVQPPAAGVWEGAAVGAPQRWFPSRTKKPIRAARTLSPTAFAASAFKHTLVGPNFLNRNKKKALGPPCERSPHEGLFRWPGPRNLALPQTNLKWCGEGVPAAGDPRGGQKPEPSARGRLGSPVASSEAAPVWGSRVPSPALGDLSGGGGGVSSGSVRVPPLFQKRNNELGPTGPVRGDRKGAKVEAARGFLLFSRLCGLLASQAPST